MSKTALLVLVLLAAVLGFAGSAEAALQDPSVYVNEVLALAGCVQENQASPADCVLPPP